MSQYLVRRVFEAVPLLLLLTLAVFVVLQALPAGPLSIYENDPSLTAEDVRRLEERFGLHEPLPLRYVRWVGALAQGDLGYSVVAQQPVAVMIAARLPNTFLLIGLALAVSLTLAIPAGIVAALRESSWVDHAITTLSLVGYALPTFWSGLLAIILFSVLFREWGLPALPASGMVTLGAPDTLRDRLAHLVLPVGVLALAHTARYTRYTRASMLEVIRQDFIRTARAKGLGEWLVLGRHALRNAALSLVTVVALDLPLLFSGAVVTESIFAWPGMGRLFLDAAFRFDYALLLGVITIAALLVILSTILADLLYAWLDPRIRLT